MNLLFFSNVYKDERKICYIYQKKKQILSKIIGGGMGVGDFSVENLGLFFQS